MKGAFAAAILVGLFLCRLGAQEPPSITVYYNDRPPLYEAQTGGGFLLDMGRLILETAGLRYRFVELPSKRIQELIHEGGCDCAGIGWFRTSDREGWADFSKPFYQDMPQVALVNRGKALSLGSAVSVDRLLRAGLLLGRKDGYSFGEDLDRRIAEARTDSLSLTTEISQIVRLVALGRLDFTILGEEEAGYILRNQEGLEGLSLVRLSDAPPGNLRCFMYGKKISPSVRRKIDEAIARSLDSPAYREIEARYGIGG